MITITVKPAKRLLSNRKQWRFVISSANGQKISDRDTYANVGDIRSILQALLVEDDVQLRVHYRSGVIQTTPLRPAGEQQ